MKKNIYHSICIILSLGLILHSCGKDDSPTTPAKAGPIIKSFTPLKGEVGETIWITGEEFGSTTASNTVKIGNTTAVVTSASATEIFITVPEGATTGTISITVDGKTDTAGTFTVAQDVTSNIVALSKTEIELFTLDSETLSFASGVDANTNVDWSSNNENVATVDDNGKITGIAVGSTIIAATVGENEVKANVTVNPNVYVAGVTGLHGTYATLWKNGNLQELSNNSDSYAHSVFVDDDNVVYIAGKDGVGGITTAVLWVEGSPQYFDASKHSSARSVIVDNNGNVYVGGRMNEDQRNKAVLWVNGNPTILSSEESTEADVHSVFVDDNGDVYATGYETVNGVLTPILWANGNRNLLVEDLYHSVGHSVFVGNGDVYVGGYKNNQNFIKVATLWRNGQIFDLSDGITNGRIVDIFGSGENIYMAAHEMQGNADVAVLWINDQRTQLDGQNAYAQEVFAHDDNAYVVGYELVQSQYVAKLWKNGEGIFLPKEGEFGSVANSVFVK